MRIYLSGAMRGIEDHNFPEFNRVANVLRYMGHDVLNPAQSPLLGEHPSRTACLRHDIMLILGVDSVVVINGWEESPGARLEVAEAWSIGIPVFRFKETALVRLDDVRSVNIPREDRYLDKTPLIGLCGYAQAGKDSVASVLVEQGSWVRVGFADPLKNIARAIGWNGEKDEAGRVLLQRLGVGVREHLMADAWILAAENTIEGIKDPVVISDVRFKNEISMIRRRGGKIVRVVRPGYHGVNNHVSEHDIEMIEPDFTIHNDGSLYDLDDKVIEMADRMMVYVGA